VDLGQPDGVEAVALGRFGVSEDLIEGIGLAVAPGAVTFVENAELHGPSPLKKDSTAVRPGPPRAPRGSTRRSPSCPDRDPSRAEPTAARPPRASSPFPDRGPRVIVLRSLSRVSARAGSLTGGVRRCRIVPMTLLFGVFEVFATEVVPHYASAVVSTR